MKRIYFYIIILISVLSSCFDDNEILLPEAYNYLAFSTVSTISTEGSDDSEITVEIVYSGSELQSDLEIPLLIEADGDVPVTEGVDYKLTDRGNIVTISKGSYTSNFRLSILNNDKSAGARVLTLKIPEIDGYNLGAPDAEELGAHQVTILEDDYTIFGYTSFEEPQAGEINNFHAQGTTDQINVENQNSVDFTYNGGEMGFDTYYIPGEEGGEDSGLLFGVTKFAADTGWGYDVIAFPDGAQAYSTSDSDGLMEIAFDNIDLSSNVQQLQISFDVWFADASWEESDEFDLFWRTEDGDEVVLSLRSNGKKMTDSADGSGRELIEEWTHFTRSVSNVKPGQLIIQIGSNSGSEISFIDNIKIEGI